jgi:uncharacterized protein with LGFP repeats
LFTAIAATVMLLPCAVYGLPGDRRGHDQPPASAATQLAQQPLTAPAGTETIREVTQSTPFSVVALTSEDLTGTKVRFRARRSDGSWGPWYDAETDETDAAEPAVIAHSPRGTAPIYVGRTTSVQIAVTRPPAPPPNRQPALGYIPANVEQPLGQNLTAVLISPPQTPADAQWSPPTALVPAGQPPNIISRAQWGADESMRCGTPKYDNAIRAGVVHHTAGSNDYSPADSAEIIRSIYAYHTRTLGWCDIGYNALVDKYGQVFEGRAGGITKAVEGTHAGGFNTDTWGVAMIGDYTAVPPTPVELRAVGRLLGWRLALDHVDPRATVVLKSDGGPFTFFPGGATPTLPTIFAHRDVGNTACPGDAAYALMDRIRDIAARFNQPPNAEDLADSLRGGAIYQRWQSLGGMSSFLGAPTSPEAAGEGSARYVRFAKGAVYWSPGTGAQPIAGAIYDAWANLGFERGPLGMPTSGEIQEPQWIGQNFQHGTLNFDRESGQVTRVLDGVAAQLPPTPASGPPPQIERFSAPIKPLN